MDIEAGNAGDLDTGDSGWFVGYGPWTRSGALLRFMPPEQTAQGIQIKWMVHPAGDPRGEAKPPSRGRTLSLLVSPAGRFRLEFAPDGRFRASERITHILRRPGDFVIWGADIHHRWTVEAACTVLTIRWTPLPPAAAADPAAG